MSRPLCQDTPCVSEDPSGTLQVCRGGCNGYFDTPNHIVMNLGSEYENMKCEWCWERTNKDNPTVCFKLSGELLCMKCASEI
jgi:hypothetical protein